MGNKSEFWGVSRGGLVWAMGASGPGPAWKLASVRVGGGANHQLSLPPRSVVCLRML